MSRLHIDVEELPRELDFALTHLARGGEVLVEQRGRVVARLAPVAEPAATAGAGEFDPGALIASFDRVDAVGSVPNPFAAMAMFGHPGEPGQSLAEGWDELAREEEFLESLAGEMAEESP